MSYIKKDRPASYPSHPADHMSPVESRPTRTLRAHDAYKKVGRWTGLEQEEPGAAPKTKQR